MGVSVGVPLGLSVCVHGLQGFVSRCVSCAFVGVSVGVFMGVSVGL